MQMKQKSYLLVYNFFFIFMKKMCSIFQQTIVMGKIRTRIWFTPTLVDFS